MPLSARSPSGVPWPLRAAAPTPRSLVFSWSGNVRVGSSLVNTALDSLTQDLLLAARGMLQSPGFSAAAILTLAICIGATTAVFSVIDATLLRPLAYHDPDRLYVVHELLPQMKAPVVPVNAIHFRGWRTAARSFEDMALLF